MKFNSFGAFSRIIFLKLLFFSSFSLFSMNEKTSPKYSPKSPRSLAIAARKNSDPLVRLPDSHLCTGCGERIKAEELLAHDMDACKLAKIIALMSSSSISKSRGRRPIEPSPLHSRTPSIVDLTLFDDRTSMQLD